MLRCNSTTATFFGLAAVTEAPRWHGRRGVPRRRDSATLAPLAARQRNDSNSLAEPWQKRLEIATLFGIRRGGGSLGLGCAVSRAAAW